MSEKKKSGGALLGAAFLMATSAIGPGFLTQTATFTGQYQESFGFVILVSVILAAIAQLNIWRVLCVTGLRGQDVSNKVLPGRRKKTVAAAESVSKYCSDQCCDASENNVYRNGTAKEIGNDTSHK